MARDSSRLRRPSQGAARRRRRQREVTGEDAKGEKEADRLSRLVHALRPTFLSNIKRGVIMNDRELRATARRKSLPPLSAPDIDHFRKQWPHLQRFRDEKRERPRLYQALVRCRFGTAFVDVGFIGEKRHNKGHVGFLLGVEALSGTLGAIAIKRRTLGAFEEAFEKLIRLTQLDSLHLVLCDREVSLYSRVFAERQKARHGLRLRYLKTRSKAYLAERAIRTVKTTLQACMDTLGTKAWVDLLPGCIRGLNSRKVPGTDFAPREVNADNVTEFLKQRWGVANFRALFNTATVNARNISNKEWLRHLFRFELGGRVLVSLRALGRRGPFHKSSVAGNYAAEIYVVCERFLATSRDLRAVPGEKPTLEAV